MFNKKSFMTIVLLLICIPCNADMLILRNGQQIEGEIISFRKDKIKIQTETGNKKIHYTLIKDIQSNTQDENKKYILDQARESMEGYDLKVKDQASRKQEIIKSRRVDFYMYPTCPYCRKMDRFLKENNIPHNRYNIKVDAQAKRRYEQISRNKCGVPFLVIDGKYTVCGYNPAKLMKYLQK